VYVAPNKSEVLPTEAARPARCRRQQQVGSSVILREVLKKTGCRS